MSDLSLRGRQERSPRRGQRDPQLTTPGPLPMHTQHPTTHRLPVIPQGGGGGQRGRHQGKGRTGAQASDHGTDGAGAAEVDRVGKGGGTHGRRSPNGRTTHSAPPFPTPQTSPLMRRLLGVNSGMPAAWGESVERRADAVASRESPLGHVSQGPEDWVSGASCPSR